MGLPDSDNLPTIRGKFNVGDDMNKIIGALLVSVMVVGCSMFSRHEETPPPAAESQPVAANENPNPQTDSAKPSVWFVKKGTNQPVGEAPSSHTGMWGKSWSEKVEPAAANTPPQWSYEGESGPEHWASLNRDYAKCGEGKNQSPVDLKWHKPSKGGGKLSLNYRPTAVQVENTGHTIQASFDSGNFASYEGSRYELLQMHFHTPSEHTFSGKSHPMEAHFDHKNDSGDYLVLAVMFDEGSENAAIGKIWENIPGEKKLASSGDLSFKPSILLPTTHNHYTYSGSLTSPPCSENVKWVVFNTPLTMSADQMSAFKKFYPKNARPEQPLGSRKVLNY